MKFEGHYETRDIGHVPHMFGKTPIYRVTLNLDFPLIFTDSKGITYRPDMCFSSDGGSIPDIIQRLPIPFASLRRDCYKRAYFFHDNAYQNHGIWILNPVANRFHFAELDRGTVDNLLRECLQAEGANSVERSLIYAGVRAGGWVPWWKKK